MKVLQNLSNIIGKLLEILVVSLSMLMTVLMFAQVLGRFLFKNGLFWAEELSRFTMFTMVYLGAALACKHKDHISITILEGFLKKVRIAHKLYKLAIGLISIAFLVIIAKIGFSVLHIVSKQISANMQITMNYVYMMLPISSCIMIFYIILEILQVFFGQKTDSPALTTAEETKT